MSFCTDRLIYIEAVPEFTHKKLLWQLYQINHAVPTKIQIVAAKTAFVEKPASHDGERSTEDCVSQECDSVSSQINSNGTEDRVPLSSANNNNNNQQ
jgi:hypothetical protein